MLAIAPLYPKAAKFNANVGTTNYIFSGTTTPNGLTPEESSVMVRVTVNLATTGTLTLGMYDGTNTITGTIGNAGGSLTGGIWYVFDFEARQGYKYDFKISAGTNVNALFVSEIAGGIAP